MLVALLRNVSCSAELPCVAEAFMYMQKYKRKRRRERERLKIEDTKRVGEEKTREKKKNKAPFVTW